MNTACIQQLDRGLTYLVVKTASRWWNFILKPDLHQSLTCKGLAICTCIRDLNRLTFRHCHYKLILGISFVLFSMVVLPQQLAVVASYHCMVVLPQQLAVVASYHCMVVLSQQLGVVASYHSFDAACL